VRLVAVLLNLFAGISGLRVDLAAATRSGAHYTPHKPGNGGDGPDSGHDDSGTWLVTSNVVLG
jgi:hypothetical protein